MVKKRLENRRGCKLSVSSNLTSSAIKKGTLAVPFLMADAVSSRRTHQFDKMSEDILEIERSERPEGREASRHSVNLTSSDLLEWQKRTTNAAPALL